MLSATTLGSASKSMFTRLSSFTHYIANKRSKASAMSTSIIGVSQLVLVITKFPSAPRIEALIPTLLREVENDAPTLHLNLPATGFVHLITGFVHLIISLCILFEALHTVWMATIPHFLESYIICSSLIGCS